MQNTPFLFGPIALTNTLTTNLLNPATTTGGVNMGTPNTYILLTHVRWLNKTASPATISHFLGASAANAAGTEVFDVGATVPANGHLDWYGRMKIKVAQFLVGGASANTTITMQGEGEYGLEF